MLHTVAHEYGAQAAQLGLDPTQDENERSRPSGPGQGQHAYCTWLRSYDRQR